MKNITRHAVAVFWSILEQFSITGVPRLILFPIVAYIVGKNEFGLFATAISFILIIGCNPANGLSIGLLRNLALYHEAEQKQLNSTAVRMSHIFLFYFILVGLLVLAVIMGLGLIDKRTYLCLTFLSISLYAENQFMLLLSPLRYKRLFKEHSLWYVGRSVCILVFGVSGTYLGGIVGLALGMMLVNIITFWFLSKKYYQSEAVFNSEYAKVLRSVWFHITVAGALMMASPHLNRIVLRIYSDNESVADLFAATSIAYVFIAPISNFSGLFLSMISKYKTAREISGHVFRKIFILMLSGALIVTVLFGFAAPVASKLLFPGFGDRMSGLFMILIWMVPANVITALMRPLITKFANVAWIPRINFAVLIIMLVLMFSLIPRYGIIGAAWSISMGNIFEAILRIIIFGVVYKKSIGQKIDLMPICENQNSHNYD